MEGNQVIPARAVEAALSAYYERGGLTFASAHPDTRAAELQDMRAALEAAAPHMLSHEREQTRLAHLDAMVNAETANRLQRQLDAIEATP